MKTSDDMILNGFRTFNSDITKEYFYGYCRRAYNVLNSKYDLENKVGLDFMSLAHEYYMYLLIHEFKPLADRPQSMKLSAYMYKGFWFVVMDALKAHKHEFAAKSKSDADDVLRYVRSSDYEEGLLEQVTQEVDKCYNDRKMTELATMFFILGYSQKEISEHLGISPSAVNQRYKKMMDEVITPFVMENYGRGIYRGAEAKASICPTGAMPVFMEPSVDACAMCEESIITTPTNMDNRITPEFVTTLKPNEIFVFGSNLRGIHAGGAARMAYQHFGAEMGNGVGIQGQSYAIPTMQGGVETIEPYVNDFIKYAKEHPELIFLVTPIGCGIAGFDAEDMAPLFRDAVNVSNIHLPEEFWDWLEDLS